MEEKKTYLVNVESNLEKYAQEAADAKKKVDDLVKANQDLKESGKASSAEIEASNSALRSAQKEYNQAKKLVDLQTQANNSNVNSRKQLDAIVKIEQQRLGALANQYTINAKGQRVLSDEYLKAVKNLKNAKDAVIAYDKAQSDGRSNIGRYGESVAASFKSMGASMLSALGPVALLTAGLGKLKEAFLSSEAGAKAQKMWSEGIKTFFANILKGDMQFAGAKAIIAAQYAKKADEIRKGNRKDLVEIAKLETEIDMLSLKAADNTKSKAEQEEILLKIKGKEEELIKYKKADLQEDLDYVQMQLSINEENTDLLNEEARLQAEIIKLDGERSIKDEKRRTAIRQAEKEQAEKDKLKAEKDMQDSKDKLTKEIEAYKDSMLKLSEDKAKQDQKTKQDKEDLLQWELDRELQNNENLLQIREQNNEYSFNIERARLEAQHKLEVAQAKKTGADINIINAKYAAAQRQIDKAESDAKLMLYADFAGNLATIFGEQTAIGKAAAIAQTAISTYAAAQKAYESLIAVPVVGPVLAPAAAAAAVVSGLANVKKIMDIKSGLPGESSVSASVPTTISSPKITAQPVTNIFNQPQLSQPQLNAISNQGVTSESLIKALEAMPAPVTYIEDIERVSKRTNKIKTRANI